ncbi:aminotransferase, class V [Staphylothermus marinus F1]|uniref:cysteine desulfurase n=1 Tax=Staphylothermus marinus (strain ATCC 43588 / DSM 3639 / JCM 9404 / F1) TaxID=399550 RepID=A3DMC7_STAMF|nr:cysteine desulfurase [Staphylothermus marinus]ABN69787.1 aminotransferase, class V [Staphylothermus marinus F1]
MTTSLDPYLIRNDFPLLHRYNIVYLDNAATTQKPYYVINAITDYYREYNANIHRGLYELSEKSTELYEDTKEYVAKFLNASSWDEVIYTRNASEALNIIAYSLAFSFLKPGDEVITTIMEHHSNLLPWLRLSKTYGIKVKIAKVSEREGVLVKHIENLITERTKVIAFTHASNVTGVINSVKKITSLARKNNIITVLDAAQSIPHLRLDVRDLGIDFTVFSAHKILGPMGIGVIWGRRDLLENMIPVMLGGDMVKNVTLINRDTMETKVKYNDLPWKFEAGTPNVAGAVGLKAALEYVNKIGYNNIRSHEIILSRTLIKELQEAFGDRIRIIGPLDPTKRTGLVAFTFRDNVKPEVVATWLASKNICVRAGFHCAEPLHEYLGLLDGSVRASYYIYNTMEDIEKLVTSLKELMVKIYG